MHTGIDLGLQVTSMSTLDDNGILKYKFQFGTVIQNKLKNARKAHPAERYKLYYDYFSAFFLDNPIVGTVVMEEPLGMLLGNGRKIIELKGVYLIALGNLGIPVNKIYLPKPTQIKKAFTRNGHADKQQMMDECIKRGHLPSNDHEADSIAMAYMSIEGTL